MSDKRPVPVVPDGLEMMTPRQAWNAALEAIAPVVEWEAFWNDGQDLDVLAYRIEDDSNGD